MFPRRKKGPKIKAHSFKELPIYKFIPNIITLTALCSGLTSLHFVLKGRVEISLMLIFIAMIFDGMDGRVARLLNSSSRFGAELDSLADFCNFGIVPSLVIYIHAFQPLGRLGWAIVLLYSICMVMRLARFNTLLDQEGKSSSSSRYFFGVPAPFGAFLALIPLTAEFQNFSLNLTFYSIWLLLISGLLVSRVPTFSFKQGQVQKKWIPGIFISVAFVIGAFIVNPWITLSCVAGLYLLLIPYSYHCYKKEQLPAAS